MFTDSSASWDSSMVVYFLPLFLVPTAALLLWFRKKHGWTLSALFFSYTAAGAIPLFISALNRQPSGNAALDTLLPVVSPTVIFAFRWNNLGNDKREHQRSLRYQQTDNVYHNRFGCSDNILNDTYNMTNLAKANCTYPKGGGFVLL